MLLTGRVTALLHGEGRTEQDRESVSRHPWKGKRGTEKHVTGDSRVTVQQNQLDPCLDPPSSKLGGPPKVRAHPAGNLPRGSCFGAYRPS